jgi:hypothetical protein
MSLIKGKPDLRFKVYKGGTLVHDFTLDGYTEFDEDYEPVFLSHELDNNELVRRLDGFRYRARVYFEKVDGTKLLALATIVTVGDYDKILFYPNSIDKPLYYLDVTIDDDTVKLATFYLLAQKEFELKLLSRKLEDWIPLTLADFTHWGNISIAIQDITKTFSQLN